MVIYLLLGAIFISSAPILVKFAQMEPTSLAFFRCFLAFLILLPWCIKSFGRLHQIKRRNWLFILGGSICFALDLFVWHRSIYIVGAGMATVLGNTQALYLAFLGFLFLGEKLSLRFFGFLLLAFVGVYFLVDPLGVGQHAHPDYYLGVLYGLLTGLAYSGYIFFLRLGQNDISKMPTLDKLAFISGLTSLALLGIGGTQSNFELPNSENWVWVFLLALLPQVIGWLLITFSLPKVRVTQAGLILLLQPVLASVWGYLFFDEILRPTQILGGVAVLIAIYGGSQRTKANPSPTESPQKA